MFECKLKTLKLGLVLGTVLALLIISLQACGSLPASATSASVTTDGVVVTLSWDEWQDLANCVRFVSDDIGLTLEVASAELDANTAAEARETVNRLTRLGAKLDKAGQDSSAGMPAEDLGAILDAQLLRTQQFVDLQTRLFDARMTALVGP